MLKLLLVLSLVSWLPGNYHQRRLSTSKIWQQLEATTITFVTGHTKKSPGRNGVMAKGTVRMGMTNTAL